MTIPELWLPDADVRRLILHWTAGAHQPSLLDKAHYHFLIAADGAVHRGARPPGRWLPHTRSLNTGSIGIALCGMAGATQHPFHPGRFPLTVPQYEAAGPLLAQLLDRYELRLQEKTVLVHADVERVYGIKQRGKWDIMVWALEGGGFVPVTAAEASRRFRLKVRDG